MGLQAKHLCKVLLIYTLLSLPQLAQLGAAASMRRADWTNSKVPHNVSSKTLEYCPPLTSSRSKAKCAYMTMVVQSPCGVCTTGVPAIGCQDPHCLCPDDPKDLNKFHPFTLRDYFTGTAQDPVPCPSPQTSLRAEKVPHEHELADEYWPSFYEQCKPLYSNKIDRLHSHWRHEGACASQSILKKYKGNKPDAYYQQIWDLFIGENVSEYVLHSLQKLPSIVYTLDQSGFGIKVPTDDEMMRAFGHRVHLKCQTVSGQCILTSVGLCYSCVIKGLSGSEFCYQQKQSLYDTAPGRQIHCNSMSTSTGITWDQLPGGPLESTCDDSLCHQGILVLNA